MAQKRSRSDNFTTEEKLLLIDLISENRYIVENKKTDAVSSSQKENVWNKIAEVYRASSGRNRTIESLKSCWDNLKKKTRKVIVNNKMKIMKTGGGTARILQDPIIERVKGILSISLDGLVNPYDCDASFVLPVSQTDDQNSDVDNPTSAEIMLDDIQVWAKWSPQMLWRPITVHLEPLIAVENTPTTSNSFPTTNSAALEASFSVPITPVSSAINPVSLPATISHTSTASIFPSAPNLLPTTATPNLLLTSATPSSSKTNTRSTWVHRRRPRCVQTSTAAEELAESKLQLTKLAAIHAEEEHEIKKEEHQMRKEEHDMRISMLSVHNEYAKTMLEIAKLELKWKRKKFENDFKESAE